MASMEMDPEVAKGLFTTGSTLVLLDVPANTEFGIDYHCWRTGPNFRGVKMIPPGVHFVYTSAADASSSGTGGGEQSSVSLGSLGMRSGFFHAFKAGEIVAKKWNKENEAVDDYQFTDEELERYAEAIKFLFYFRGPEKVL